MCLNNKFTAKFCFIEPFLQEEQKAQNRNFFCKLDTMGYFLSNILVYGFLFVLIVVGYNAIREMRNKKK